MSGLIVLSNAESATISATIDALTDALVSCSHSRKILSTSSASSTRFGIVKLHPCLPQTAVELFVGNLEHRAGWPAVPHHHLECREVFGGPSRFHRDDLACGLDKMSDEPDLGERHDLCPSS